MHVEQEKLSRFDEGLHELSPLMRLVLTDADRILAAVCDAPKDLRLRTQMADHDRQADEQAIAFALRQLGLHAEHHGMTSFSFTSPMGEVGGWLSHVPESVRRMQARVWMRGLLTRSLRGLLEEKYHTLTHGKLGLGDRRRVHGVILTTLQGVELPWYGGGDLILSLLRAILPHYIVLAVLNDQDRVAELRPLMHLLPTLPVLGLMQGKEGPIWIYGVH